jgi:uncharacterized protein YjiS (DUF1127 family)
MLRRTIRGNVLRSSPAQAGSPEGSVQMSLSDQARFLPDTQQKIISDLLRWLFRARALVRRLGGFWTARRQRARELDELYRFTDRELADLGLSKSDLPAIGRGAYHRE